MDVQRKLIQALSEELKEERFRFKEQWDRILPMNELLSDRWEKAELAGAGRGASIYDSSVIMGAPVIGENVWIGPFCVIEAINGCVTIGDFCSISSGVQIYTHDTVRYALSGGEYPAEKGDVFIGRCTYIGSQAVVSRGVRIGSHVVVGANSLVNRDIPDYSIAWGTPARVVGRVVIEGDNVRFEYEDQK